MKRLSKSNIEYLDYVWNFASGCHHGETGVCPVGDLCWAKNDHSVVQGELSTGV